MPAPRRPAKRAAGGGSAAAVKKTRESVLPPPRSADPRFDTSAFSSDDEDAGEQHQPAATTTTAPSPRQPSSQAQQRAAAPSGSGSEDDLAPGSDRGAESGDEDDLLADLEEPSSGQDNDDDAPAPRHQRGPGDKAEDGEAGALSQDDDDDAAGAEGEEGGTKRRLKKVLSAERVARMTATADKRGIVYISRIPPHMKPHKLRQLLAQHGELGRVYCAPEDPALRRMRKAKGGNTGKNFTEGWVEFDDKRRAKRAALQLNGQPMGGRHRSAYRYDLWNLKYLPRFKWDHLTEEVSYQRAVREQKLAVEISAAKRERDFYLSRVDRAKGMVAQTERRAAKAAADGASAGGAAAAAVAGPPAAADARGVRRERHYGQRKLKADRADLPELSGDVLALLGGKRRAALA